MRYSYRCPECGVFTIEQSMKDEPISECPDCGQPVKRIIGKNVNVIFKTGGFYCTDKGGSCRESASASDAAAESACAGCEHHEAHMSS